MAKECYLEIDGKRTKLTDEQLKVLGLYEEPKKGPFDRVEKGENYYFIHSCGKLESTKDFYWDNDKKRHNAANYCTDKEILQQRALHETLNRLLWRFSIENDGDKIQYTPKSDLWGIWLNTDAGELHVAGKSGWYQSAFEPVFYSREIANQALETIVKPFIEEHPDFIW